MTKSETTLWVKSLEVDVLPEDSPSPRLGMEQGEVNHTKLSSHLPDLIYINFSVKKDDNSAPLVEAAEL